MVQQSRLVQMVDNHTPFLVTPDSIETVFAENSKRQIQSLPPELEIETQSTWAEHVLREQAAGRSPTDQNIVYLLAYERRKPSRSTKTPLVLEVRVDKYSKSHFFNRADEEMQHTPVAQQHGYDCLAAWVMVTTKDNKAVFISKPHHGEKKVSGFSGFNSEDEIAYRTRYDHTAWAMWRAPDFVDYPAWVDRLFNRYSGNLKDIPRKQFVLGLNFLPEVGPRGYDLVCGMKLDITAAELQRMLASDPAFSNLLIIVPANPQDLLAFLHRTDLEPTTSCVGGVMQYIGSHFPERDLHDCVANYHGSVRLGTTTQYAEVAFKSDVKYSRK